MNAEATTLCWPVCKTETVHQIHEDVVIVSRREEFGITGRPCCPVCGDPAPLIFWVDPEPPTECP